MVGVPRSGGCNTCRTRRIRCDETKPGCQRCQTDRRICEGYERWHTYVNKTAKGIQKRRRLEEAIPSTRMTESTSHEQMALQSSSLPQLPSNDDASRKDLQFGVNLIQWKEEDITDRAILDAFLQIYQPSDSENKSGATNIWLKEACSFRNPCPALQRALHALATNRVAANNNDSTLAKTSRESYSKALGNLNELLESPESMFDDQALAAVRCMMIYELFESTTKSVYAWASHQNGLARLVKLRGPKGFSDHFAERLLMDARSVSMIASVQHSCGSFLGDEEWRLATEPNNLLDAEHRIYDLAFDLASLYEQEDKALDSGKPNSAQQFDRLRQLDAIIFHFEGSINTTKDLKPAETLYQTTEYWNLESAIHIANILTLILDASVVFREVYNRVEDHSKIEQGPALIIEKYRKDRDQKIGERILSALKYTTGDDMGLYGAQKSLFALRLMLHNLDRQGLVYEQASKMYDDLMLRRGLRHTIDLNKQWGELKCP